MAISPFKDGYGNFHFKHTQKIHWSDRRNLDLPTLFNSEDTVEKPINSTFSPFLHLPLDLRNQIYALLLQHFRSSSTNSKIEIGLEPLYSDSTATWRNYAVLSPHRLLCHQGAYYWEQNPHLSPIPGDEYYTIWSLSCVSHQVREELGALFWQNVKLDMADHVIRVDKPFMSPRSTLERFLQECPSAARGIRELEIQISYFKRSEVGDEVMVELLDTLAAHLNLDFLHVTLSFSAALMQAVVQSSEDMAWVKAFRRIQPKKLRVGFSTAVRVVNEKASERIHDEDGGLTIDIRDFDFPGTTRFIRELLSSKNALTEEESYLKSRES